MDVETELKQLADLCLKLIDHDGVDSMRPVLCVPTTKQLAFMMDRRGMVEAELVRAWGRGSAGGADFLVAYQSASDKFSIDAVVGGAVSTTTYDAPDSYI